VNTLAVAPDPDEPGDGSPFDSIRRVREDGTEYWSARELMPLLGYKKWERFADAVDQARIVIEAEHGSAAADREASRCREAFGRTRQIGDNVHLSRRACYLTAMRGDSRKPEIRSALLYFAEKTREAEVRAERPVTELELAYRYIAVLEREQVLATANAQLTEKVAELGVKAEGYDDLVAAEGYLDLGAAAKILAPATGGIGRTRFINLLRGMGVIMQNSTLPYQNLIDRGYFAVRTEVSSGAAYPYTVVTLKGLHWLQAELREDRPTLDHGNVRQLPTGSIEGPEVA
jgi:phage antirepressor YoqD-like protein